MSKRYATDDRIKEEDEFVVEYEDDEEGIDEHDLSLPPVATASHDNKKVTSPQTSTSSYTAELLANMPAHAPTPIGGYSMAFRDYDADRRWTFYSLATDIVQHDTIDDSLRRNIQEDKDDFYWLDMLAPTAQDLTTVADIIGIHPLTIEDIQSEDQREKCEIFEKYLFVCVRTCTANYFRQSITKEMLDDGMLMSEGLYVILFENRVLTVHSQPIPHIRHILRRIYPLNLSSITLTADWILYGLLDDVVDEFVPNMRAIEQEVDCIDDLVLMLRSDDQADMLRRIGHARKRVIRLMRLLKPKGEVVRTLYKRCPDRLRPTTLLYLRDVQDHLITMMQALDQAGSTLDRSHSNYLAQINIELAEASNRMNFVVKKLTAATSLVLPLSLISGIWGMNVAVPGQSGTQWSDYGPFFVMVGTMSCLMVVMFVYGRHYDWF